MRFSERQGVVPVRRVVQVDSMDAALRNRLWSVLATNCWEEPREYDGLTFRSNWVLRDALERLWHNHYKIPIDTVPFSSAIAIDTVRQRYATSKWYEVYDLLEFLANSYPVATVRAQIIADSNKILEQELSGYRFIDGKLTPITNEQEIAAIERATSDSATLFPHSAQHLQQAIALLSQRPRPDYRNSIKESISAVEALCGAITGDSKATLGKALKAINLDLHPALQSAFERLYGYTSDGDGIRHALMEDQSLEQEDAIFMVVACSAFISYVVAKYSKTRKG
jgi:AbiJ N-terminal domain 4